MWLDPFILLFTSYCDKLYVFIHVKTEKGKKGKYNKFKLDSSILQYRMLSRFQGSVLFFERNVAKQLTVCPVVADTEWGNFDYK